MFRKIKKSIAVLLLMSLSFGMSTTALAAGPTEDEDVTVINLFDPDDPNLIAIVEPVETARTTSRPTSASQWNLDQSPYTFSAYSNNNIMWTKYRFLTQNDSGKFKVAIASSTNTNYRMVFHNCLNGKDYYYKISGPTDYIGNSNVPGWTNPYLFYFGIDTTQTHSAVSVTGTVQTY